MAQQASGRGGAASPAAGAAADGRRQPAERILKRNEKRNGIRSGDAMELEAIVCPQ